MRRIRDAAPKAVADAVDGRLPAVRAATPVLTGRMKAAWRTVKTRVGARLRNSVPYASIIDRRNRIVARHVRKSELVDGTRRSLRRRLRRG